MMQTTLFLFLWLIPIAANIWLDRNGRKPNYVQMFILRGIAAILHAMLFNTQNVFDWWPILLFQVCSFWIFFEVGLNIVRGKSLLYYDTVELDSGLVDRFFAKTGKSFHAVVRLLCLVVMIWSIVVIYNRY